jgi:hypothetical protein
MKSFFNNWRGYITENIADGAKDTLFVFDFDHTLAKSPAKIIMKDTDEHYSQEEYDSMRKNEPHLTEKDFDYSEFQDFSLVEPIYPVMERFVDSFRVPNSETYVLTARPDGSGVKNYLQNLLNIPNVEVIAINSSEFGHLEGSDASKKAAWIENKLKEGFNTVKYWEDSVANAVKVKNLKKKHDNVNFEVFLVNLDQESYDFSPIEESSKYKKYQNAVKKRHPGMKKRLIKHGNQPTGDPYDVKPSFKRSKSAPPGFGGS